MLPPIVRRDLEGIFGERISTEPATCQRESRDWGVLYLAPAFRDLLDSCVADAVVWPVNLDEVVDTLKLARRFSVPVVARGAGTGNVGGVLPLRGGIIVETEMMNKLLRADDDVVWVEAGARFPAAMKAIRARGLDFRVYPTSYAVSTIGGFVAGGSRGIGAYEYGLIWDNVAALELVLPGGDVVSVQGSDVELGTHAFGTTGVITKVKVMPKPRRDEAVQMATFPKLEDVAKAASALARKQLPLWHIVARDPAMSGLIAELMGFGDRAWTLTMAYPQDQSVERFIAQVVKECDGQLTETRIIDPETRDRLLSGIFGFPTTPRIVRSMQRRDPNSYLLHVVQYFPPSEIWDKVRFISNARYSSTMMLEVSYYRVRGRLLGHLTIWDEGGLRTFQTMQALMTSAGGGFRFDLHSFYVNDRLGSLAPEKLIRMISFKRQVDSEDLMNPGKLKLTV